MKAFVIESPGTVALLDKPIPEPAPNEAVIQATAALLCTSDQHTVRGAIPVPSGRTLGHEAVGIVHAVGSEVTSVRVGQRVVASGLTPCWECPTCQRGFPSQCGGTALGGLKFTIQQDGNLSEYFTVPAAQANLAPIPDGVPDDTAVYATDMLSTGFMGVEHAELQFGETIAIFAQGAVGLSATIGARIHGAGLIIAVESDPVRQELARHFGADVVVDFTKSDPVQQIRELTGGAGVDAAVEALGSQRTWQAALECTKPGGRVSNLGYHGDDPAPLPVPLEAFGLGMADKQIYGGLCPGGSDRMTRLLRLIDTGKVDPGPMTTHEFGFDEVEKAFRMMGAHEDGIIKPLIRF